ncbi:MAG: hypothetical protein HRU19_20990 [Pseudobacteriovorax sp.]|nr:hypothetical protein [Pseudobacteriovorax sp.]
MKFVLFTIISMTLSFTAFGSIDKITDSDHTLLLELLNQRAQAEVADKTCDSDEQCKFVGFGSKPCGGSWTYLIYSELTTNTERFSNLVEIYNSLDAENNIRIGLFSDCALALPPKVACDKVSNSCVAQR